MPARSPLKNAYHMNKWSAPLGLTAAIKEKFPIPSIHSWSKRMARDAPLPHSAQMTRIERVEMSRILASKTSSVIWNAALATIVTRPEQQ